MNDIRHFVDPVTLRTLWIDAENASDTDIVPREVRTRETAKTPLLLSPVLGILAVIVLSLAFV